MAISSSQIQQYLKEAFPSSLASMQVQEVMVPSGRMRTVDEIVGYGESGPLYGSRQEPEMVVGGYYSPELKRQLSAEEARYLIPIKSNVDGQGQVTTGLVFPGKKGIDAINALGLDPSIMSGQNLGQGLEIYPTGAIPTDEGGRTNIALRYGSSGGPEAYSYQSGTLTGSAGLDKIVDTLAKAANTALLTSVGGMALGPAGAGLLGKVGAGAVAGAALPAIQGKDTQDIIRGALGGAVSGYLQPAPIVESMPTSFGVGMPVDEAITAAQAAELAGMGGITPEMAASNLGLLEGSMGIPGVVVPPDVAASNLGLLESSMGPPLPSSMPGVADLRLDVMPQPQVQPALGNLDKSMLFSDTGYGGMGPTQWWETITPGDAASTLGQIEGSMGGFGGAPTEFVGPLLQTGNADKSVLLGNEGYGPMSDLTVNQAPIDSSPISSLGKGATVRDFVEFVTKGAVTGAGMGVLGSIPLSSIPGIKDLFGGNEPATTTQQQSGFGSLANTALAALLANKAPSAPQAGVSAGRAPDIVGPVASLLAPKLVQRQPISLL